MTKFLLILALLLLTSWVSNAADRPNILFICVDDLKPTIGVYGDKIAKTPNLDRLARMGMRFDKAYCNYAVCAPSRASLLSGTRTTTIGTYFFERGIRAVYPDAVTMPQYFKNHGYFSEGVGKIFHIGHGLVDDELSWSVPRHDEPEVEYHDPASTDGGKLTREEAFFSNRELGHVDDLPRGTAWEKLDVSDETYGDGRIAAEAVRRLQAAAKKPDQPFFLAVGFLRPHLPFTAPKKYWDLYDETQFKLPDYRKDPVGAPPYAAKHAEETKNYIPFNDQGKIDDKDAITMIHGYYASVSYVDAQLGKVLDEFVRLGLDKNTIIVLWGDHGWHLGDHNYWTKHTNYEQANRIPLFIVAPGVTKPDTQTGRLVESVDLYPTLVQLAGLPKVEGTQQPIEGVSIVPILKDPNANVPGTDHVYSCYLRGEYLGRVIRNDRYRLVEWKKRGAAPETAEIELYDYENDPEERKNLAPEHPDVVKEMLKVLYQYPEGK